ncbi:MAG: hypothetical protein ABIL25_01510 [candidate division WOR-3 bacterium]
MKPQSLDREFAEVLDRMRHGKKPLSVHGLSRLQSERALRDIADPLLEGAGLRPAILNEYRWFVQELARLFRSLEGNDLAFYVEACLRKWQSLGLETRTMQLLVTMLFERLAPQARRRTAKNASTKKHRGAG